MRAHRALYAAFDRVPSAKGAAIHIAHTVRALERAIGDALLVCAGDGVHPDAEAEGGLDVLRITGGGTHLVDRIGHWQRALALVLDAQRASLAICQFRDPWSGIPVLDAPGRMRRVYEVNGLPSIELPERYPRIAARTLERIRGAELRCLAESDAILVPSASIAKNLVRLGADAARISVIPNGAALPGETSRPAGAPARYVLYFGALQPWQGVGDAVAALARLADTDLGLVICSSQPRSVGRALQARAERLGVADRILWHHELSREQLAPWIAHALCTLAPLAESPRNLDQGCCPLKVLESMAAGTPVVASDLAPVRELVVHGEHGLLVRPGRPDLVARAVRRLADVPALRAEMGRRARDRVAAAFTWDAIEERLVRWYLAPADPRIATGAGP